jgi:hypothetical protein
MIQRVINRFKELTGTSNFTIAKDMSGMKHRIVFSVIAANARTPTTFFSILRIKSDSSLHGDQYCARRAIHPAGDQLLKSSSS